MKYAPHEIANIFPLITGKEFVDLKEDIRANGLREEIWMYEDRILDGRNRFRACQEAGVEPRLRQYDGDDPVGFAAKANIKSRNLNAGQRAACAVAYLEIAKKQKEEAQGKKNQWIYQARKEFKPSEKKDCLVCGRFMSVAQAHHIYPLAWQYDQGYGLANHEHAWLCPTHHALSHLSINYILGSLRPYPDVEDADSEEVFQVIEPLVTLLTNKKAAN